MQDYAVTDISPSFVSLHTLPPAASARTVPTNGEGGGEGGGEGLAAGRLGASGDGGGRDSCGASGTRSSRTSSPAPAHGGSVRGDTRSRTFLPLERVLGPAQTPACTHGLWRAYHGRSARNGVGTPRSVV
eukprot:7075800-Prymnesium_polylepis.1